MEHPKYTTYVLYSLKDHQFYIGYTANFNQRMLDHEAGKTKSTAPRRPFQVIFCEYYFSKEDAMRREMYFKTSAEKKTLRLMLRESLKEIKQIKI